MVIGLLLVRSPLLSGVTAPPSQRLMPGTATSSGCSARATVWFTTSSSVAGSASKFGLDCTIPMGPQFSRAHFDRSTAFEPDDPPADIVAMDEDELSADMEALIGEAPRTWKEILQHYNGQPYPIIYRAFSNLRPRLGRCDDAPWYRYTFSDSDFAVEAPQPALSNFDPRHGM
jgi:4-hydroxy-3-polyprenylbenzoate decarboxylase